MRVLWLSLAVAGAGTASASAPIDPELPPAISRWMPKNVLQAWQGAWAGHLRLVSMAGEPVAFEFQGATGRMSDGRTESAVDFQVAAPCDARISHPMHPGPGVAAGAKFIQHMQFVIVGGELRAADGDAGYRKGKAAIACVSGANFGVYTLDAAGTCTRWDPLWFWKSTPAKCTWTREDGKDVLAISGEDGVEKLIAHGDVLEDAQFQTRVSQGYFRRAASYDAAKAALAATHSPKAR